MQVLHFVLVLFYFVGVIRYYYDKLCHYDLTYNKIFDALGKLYLL